MGMKWDSKSDKILISLREKGTDYNRISQILRDKELLIRSPSACVKRMRRLKRAMPELANAAKSVKPAVAKPTRVRSAVTVSNQVANVMGSKTMDAVQVLKVFGKSFPKSKNPLAYIRTILAMSKNKDGSKKFTRVKRGSYRVTGVVKTTSQKPTKDTTASNHSKKTNHCTPSASTTLQVVLENGAVAITLDGVLASEKNQRRVKVLIVEMVADS
jgi:hypothetical protein